MTCERCGKAPATTHQEYRDSGDRPYWPNRITNRCDRCAQDLREYVALPSISMTILIDEPRTTPKFKRVAEGDYETADGRFRLYRLREVHPPAWNVEEVTFDAIADAEPGFGYDGLVVDGAESKRAALALFEAWVWSKA